MKTESMQIKTFGKAGNDRVLAGGEEGFSLIDILVAIAILSFGLLSWGSFIGSTVDRNTSNEWQSIAVTIAEERAEALRNLARGGTEITAANSDEASPGTTVTVSGTGATFKRITTVTSAVTPKGHKLTTITVKVTWEDNINIKDYTLISQFHQD